VNKKEKKEKGTNAREKEFHVGKKGGKKVQRK